MRVARSLAQAKINLILRIGAPDSSGYHPLLTLFQRIDLADEILVRAGGRTRSLELSGPHLPERGLGAPESNLAFRAAAAYQERAGWPGGFAIELTKNVPVGAGLGGGSADAGTVLRMLDAMAPAPMGASSLREIAAALGSDVPFFAAEPALSWGTGRGERLAPLPPLPQRSVVLAVPDFPVATADAYRWLDESRSASTPETAASSDSLEPLPISPVAAWTDVESRSCNDFEPVLDARFPELARLRRGLGAAGAKLARLAGSGSTVFGVFEQSAGKAMELGAGVRLISTRTSSHVVQVEILE